MTTPSLLDTTSAQGYIYSGAYETFQYRRFVLPYDRALVSVSNRVEPDLIALGRRQTEQLLASAARPTAIFGITDLMAMGALRALKQAGLRVPEDIAVVGFDDIIYATLTAPPLTTVSQPKYRMGVVAMGLLREAMEQKDQRLCRKVLLQTELVIRESCGAGLRGSGRGEIPQMRYAIAGMIVAAR